MILNPGRVLSYGTYTGQAYRNTLGIPEVHPTAINGAKPFYQPSGIIKGYPWPGLAPMRANQITSVQNSTLSSLVRKSGGSPANSRWSAKAIREWIVGQKLVRSGAITKSSAA